MSSVNPLSIWSSALHVLLRQLVAHVHDRQECRRCPAPAPRRNQPRGRHRLESVRCHQDTTHGSPPPAQPGPLAHQGAAHAAMISKTGGLGNPKSGRRPPTRTCGDRGLRARASTAARAGRTRAAFMNPFGDAMRGVPSDPAPPYLLTWGSPSARGSARSPGGQARRVPTRAVLDCVRVSGRKGGHDDRSHRQR